MGRLLDLAAVICAIIGLVVGFIVLLSIVYSSSLMIGIHEVSLSVAVILLAIARYVDGHIQN